MQNKQALYALALTFLGLSTTGSDAFAAKPRRAVRTAHAAPARDAAAAAAAAVSTVITSVDVSSEGEATKITIVGTQPFTPDVRSYARPSATVITIAGTWNAGRTGYTSVRKNNVLNVRAGRFSDFPHASVRIVANTRSVLPFTARAVSADKTQWEITVGDAQSIRTAAALNKTVQAVGEPAAVPILLTPPSVVVVAAPPVRAVLAPVKVSRPAVIAAAAPPPPPAKNGPYPALLRTPPPVAAVRGVPIPPSVPGAITPVLFAAPAPRPLPASAPAAKIAPADKRVSLDFVGADIVDVLKALSLQSGLNVVAGSDVKGIVTVALKNVPMIEALDMVTRLSGFRYAKVGSTYVVGTGASVAALSRSASTGQAVSASVAFYYSDGPTLEKSIMQAFPNANVSRVDVGADARKDTTGTSSTSGAAAFSGSSASINKDSATRFSPRGGVMNVVGTQDEVDAIKSFVQGTEDGLIASARQQQDAQTKILSLLTTETYRLKYASPSELVAIVNRLVPSVQIQAGPTQAFQPRTLNGSASFSSSPTSGTSGSPGGESAGGGAGGNTGAASTGTIATSGPVAPALLPPTLILTGTPPDIARARQILEQTDVRSPQMSYEAKVVDINSADLVKLGLRYDLSRVVNIGEPNLKSGGQAPTVGGTYNDDLRKPNFGTIFRSPYSITAALDALANDNKARILARPNLSALDGQSATVFIGDQIKYVINIQNTPTGQNIQTETATVGITLKVTGKSSPDGTITLYVHPEVSAVSSYVSLANGITLPQIATRFVDTTIRVKDGETVGIGGLIREEDVNNVQKVPLLGDIPFFGQLFRSRDTRKVRSEVVVFITSRILKD